MAISVKDAAASAIKWQSRASGASADYATEAVAHAQDFVKNGVAAAPTFKAAVQAGDIDRRFARGIQKAGAEKFTRGITNKGAGRYSGGITAGLPDYQANVSPYLDTLRGVTLPQRQPRGSPANLERVRAVNQALNARRVAMMAGG